MIKSSVTWGKHQQCNSHEIGSQKKAMKKNIWGNNTWKFSMLVKTINPYLQGSPMNKMEISEAALEKVTLQTEQHQ